MTLDLKRWDSEPYALGGVQEITDKTEYGDGYFAITIFDRRVFFLNCFEYVKCRETGEYFVNLAEWVKQTHPTEKGGAEE